MQFSAGTLGEMVNVTSLSSSDLPADGSDSWGALSVSSKTFRDLDVHFNPSPAPVYTVTIRTGNVLLDAHAAARRIDGIIQTDAAHYRKGWI